MNSLNHFLALGMMSLFSLSAFSQTVERIELKNGSEFEGFISEQRPGQSLMISSEKAIVYASEDSLLTVEHQSVALSTLSQEWNKWAADNQSADSSNYIKLSTVRFKNTTFSNVYIKERGTTIKFVDCNKRSYQYPWSQLRMTSKIIRPSNQFSGIVDELVMTNGNRFEGQVTDQIPGKEIKIIMDNGQVQSFSYKNIEQIISRPLNPKMSIWEQSVLLDEVVVESTGETVKGIILSRSIGKDYTVIQKNGLSKVIGAKDVKILRKVINTEYKSATDRIMSEGEIVINDDAKNAYFFNLETTETCVILEEGKASMKMERGDTLIVETNIGNPAANITIAKAQARQIERINEKGRKEKKEALVATLMDLLQPKYIGDRQITPLGHVKYTLPINESGDYILQIQGKQGFIIINVPKKRNDAH